MNPANCRPVQAVFPMGGPFHHRQGITQQCILPNRCPKFAKAQEGRLRRGERAPMERGSPLPILLLSTSVCMYLSPLTGYECKRVSQECTWGTPLSFPYNS